LLKLHELTSCFRIFVWYTIFIAIFRCPSSTQELDKNSPIICRPVLAVRSFLSPHVTPYYDQYAAPYINSARPYAEKVNERLLNPAIGYGSQAYTTYAAPRVEQAKQFGQTQWESKLQPHIESVQDMVAVHYEATLGPHVEKIAEVAGPYYVAGRDGIIETYRSISTIC
jgi:hypothetical protein